VARKIWKRVVRSRKNRIRMKAVTMEVDRRNKDICLRKEAATWEQTMMNS
jgi:hypothetical protein